MQGYQADSQKLKAANTVVLGMSMDSPAANGVFAKQIGVTFPLLSDPAGFVEKQYGVLDARNTIHGVKFAIARRTTFVIDKQGIIRHIDVSDTALNPNNAVAFCLLHAHGKGK